MSDKEEIKLEFSKKIKEHFHWAENVYEEIAPHAITEFCVEFAESYHKHQMSKELEEALKKSTGDLIQFVAVELRGEKLSDEDIESMIHDYVHPKKETKKE